MQNEAEKVLAMEQYEPNSIAFQAFGLGNVKNVTLPFKVIITLVQGDWTHRTVLCSVIPANGQPLDVAAICGSMANPQESRRHTPHAHYEFLMPTLRNTGATVQHHGYSDIGPFIDIIYQYPPNVEYANAEKEFLKLCTGGFQDAEWRDVKFTFKFHSPGFIDGVDRPPFEFSDRTGLEANEHIRRWITQPKFSKFSIAQDSLMAEFEDGVFHVVGFIKGPINELGYPAWVKPDKIEKVD